jgi:hypothetical protein
MLLEKVCKVSFALEWPRSNRFGVPCGASSGLLSNLMFKDVSTKSLKPF